MNLPLRVLLVEDSEDDAQLVLREITRGGYKVESERVETRSTMEEALARHPWDIIICDNSLPQFSAMEAIAVLKESGLDIPLIIISGTIGEEAAVTALKAGAQDFLVKGKLARLIPAIERELRDAEARRERRRAEEAVQQMQERFMALTENAPDGIALINKEGHILFVSPSARKIFGYRQYESPEINPAEHTHPDDLPMVLSALSDLIQNPTQNPTLQYRFKNKDGSWLWVESTFTNLLSVKSVEAIVINFHDITERKRAEEAMHENEVRFRNLFENTPVSIWEEDFSAVKTYLDGLKNEGVTDLEAYLRNHPEEVLTCVKLVKILDINQAALKMYKARSKTELFESLEKTYTPDVFDAFRNELLAIAKDEHSLEMDEVVQTLDGQKRDVSIHWAVAPEHENDYSRVLVSLIDITERKQREVELEAVAAVNTALRTAKSLEEMLPRMLDQAFSLIQAEEGSIWLYDAITDTNNLAFHRGWRDDIRVTSVRPGEGIPGLVVKSGETIISREFRSDPRVIAENRAYIPEGVGGICLPLHAQQQVVGAMFINVRLPREINAAEVRILNTLAEICGNAIHRTRLHEQTVKQLERLGALRVIDMAISSSMDLRLSLNLVLEQVVSQLGVDAASVLLMIPGSGRLEFAAGRGFRTSNIESTSLRLGQDYAGQAAFGKKIIQIENLAKSTDQFIRRELLASEEFIAYFGIPLIAKGEVKGVMEIFHRSKLQVDMEWLNFLDSLGWQTAIAIDNALLFEGMQRSNFDLELAYEATIEGWSKAMDLRDKETEGHTRRVTDMTLKLARLMGMKEEQLVHMRRGALLHDIGKMGVPDKILLKPGPLTDEEWRIMSMHPQLAYDLLSPISYLRQALDIPYCHHEKWDGTGYPNGLKGDLIPLSARIFAVVDVWDALTSDRPYRPAWSETKALAYIRENTRTHFDPQVVKKFLNNFSDLRKK